jgi:hypothetical protein
MYAKARQPVDPTTLVGSLLPQPAKTQLLGTTGAPPDKFRIIPSDMDLGPAEAALVAFQNACRRHIGRELIPTDDPAEPALVLQLDTPVHCRGPMPSPDGFTRLEQGYTLKIAENETLVIGNSPVGLAHGIRTLTQIAVLAGPQWPALTIEDEPAFRVRGVSYDVSRGRVPTLEFLQRLADRLAAFKINHLQLYVEHVFDFPFDPQIACGCTPLTAEELRDFDTYCSARGIALVPSLACCGHMARILGLPAYRELAEVGTDKTWTQMTWVERTRGLTLDVTNPRSRELLAQMLGEYLPMFSADRVNVCCDETFDLGAGRGKSAAEQRGTGRLLLEHLLWLRETCGAHGKRIQCWGDMLKKYPELLDELPRDVTVLNWSYVADADYDSTKLFRDAGLDTYVCPGASGWNRVINDINVADVNIRGHAAAGHECGAAGVLNTEWGDHGHVAPPACNMPALALGAALAWNPDRPDRAGFDNAFGNLWYGGGGREMLAAWRVAIEASDVPRIWPAFYAPLSTCSVAESFDTVALERWQKTAAAAARAVADLTDVPDERAADLAELQVAFSLHGFVGQRLALGRLLAEDIQLVPATELRAFAQACRVQAKMYQQVWPLSSKRSHLDEVLFVFARLAIEADRLADARA